MSLYDRLAKLEATIKPKTCPVCQGRPFVELLEDRTACGGPPAPEPTPETCPHCGNEQTLVILFQIVPAREVD
jgi:ribosomal protein S27AE